MCLYHWKKACVLLFICFTHTYVSAAANDNWQWFAGLGLEWSPGYKYNSEKLSSGSGFSLNVGVDRLFAEKHALGIDTVYSLINNKSGTLASGLCDTTNSSNVPCDLVETIGRTTWGVFGRYSYRFVPAFGLITRVGWVTTSAKAEKKLEADGYTSKSEGSTPLGKASGVAYSAGFEYISENKHGFSLVYETLPAIEDEEKAVKLDNANVYALRYRYIF